MRQRMSRTIAVLALGSTLLFVSSGSANRVPTPVNEPLREVDLVVQLTFTADDGFSHFHTIGAAQREIEEFVRKNNIREYRTVSLRVRPGLGWRCTIVIEYTIRRSLRRDPLPQSNLPPK